MRHSRYLSKETAQEILYCYKGENKMKVKKLSDILSRLIDVTLVNTTAINDFTVGSTIRSIYEAVSMEMEQLYSLTRENIYWGIQESVLSAFDFNRKKPKQAFGNIKITFNTTLTQEMIIPRGTAFESSLSDYLGVASFQTMKAYSVPSGSTQAVIEVYCTQSGTVGNFPKNTINRMLNSMSNIKSITNEQDFLTGQDEESIDALKNRFRTFVETRSRATKKAIEYGVRSIDEIAGVYVYEQTGFVTVYCHDNNGNLSNDLKTKVENALETYRPVGIKLVVSPVNLVMFSLTVNVFMDSAYISTGMQKRIQTAINAVLNTKEVGNNFILAEITQAVMNLDNSNIKNVSIVVSGNATVKDGEVQINPDQLVRAGTTVVNLKEATV